MHKPPANEPLRWFPRDRAFLSLLAGEADPTLVALEIARDAYPALDFEPSLRWIQERGQEFRDRRVEGESPRKTLTALSAVLAGEHGITGSSDAYRSADGSHLNRAMETGTGLPLTLSMLYVAVAREANVSLQGVCAPGHFLSRLVDSDSPVPLFVDAFQEGRILDLDDALARVREFAEGDREALIETLAPSPVRSIIVRMLNNLKAAYARVEAWELALATQRRLACLLPHEHVERRDLGLILLKSGRFGEGLDWLESCLSTAPVEERPVLEHHCRLARAVIAERN